MKKRIIAMLLVVLMLGQMMPINALAEGWNMIVSNEARGATYATVTFQYPIYQVNEDGTETVGSYGTIATQLVKVGEPPVQPNIPNLTGRKFERWTDEAGGTLDIHAPVQADTVFRAAYSKLEKRTVTIHYVFDVDGSMALEPYVAEFTAGTDVQLSVTSPALSGFVPEQETVTVDIPNIQEDAEYTVKYTGAPTSYTVRYHFQNVADNGYTADGFNRDAVHGHTIDDNIGAGETGWIDVGPYTITQYPEGTEHARQPVIAGGMTEVRDFEIEGFVQQEIVQRRVMPNGRTVVDVYYNRELHTYTIDNDGGTAVDSRTLRYGSSLGLPDPSEMERPSYEFVGFFSKNYAFQNGKWVQVPGEQKHDSSCKMPPYDFTIEVRWQPVQQADYKVVYWVQSVKDAYNAPNENKTYDFLDAQTFTGTVGQKPTVNQVRPQDNGLNGTFFELNAERSEIGGIRGNNSGYYAESTKEIAPDGSTVINVYFDRQTVKLEFGHYEGGWNRRWVVDYERVGLYGQNWRDAGYGTNGWPGGRWSDESGLGKGNWTYLDGFNHEDLTSTSVRLVNNDSNGRKDIYQYIEAQDSTPDNRKWIEADHYEQGQNDFNLSSKFLPGFTLYGYNTTTPEEEIRQASAGTSVSYNSRLNVFSTRNSFTLTFGNCADGSMPEQTYKYEEVLIKPETVPQRPDNVEADWEFKGWCLDAAGQVPVAWGTQTMPAANMVVYAKWAPPTYTVTYVDVRRNTVDTEQEVHTYPFEAEKFGTIMGPELEELEKQYVIDQTKYVDQDDRLTYTFMGWFIDENGTVRWNPATPITADREVYAKWEPSGTVWYRYVFLGMGDGVTEELGKWPATPFEETVWPDRPYGTFAQAAEDFAAAGMTDFPEFEGWRPMSTLSTTREKLTEQYQEIPVYYVPTSTWPLTIHYVDGETGKNLLPDEKHDLTEYAKVYSYQRIEGYTLTSAPQVRATKDDAKGPDGRVHITFTYKAVRHLPYRVEYYQENLNGGYDLLPNETVTYTEETSRWYLGETAEVQTADYKTFTGFTRNDSHKDAVTKVILREDQDNVLKLYYDRNSYTVTYIYGNAKPENAPDVPAQQTYKYGATVTVAAKPEASGYVFNGWHAFTSGTPVSGSFDMPAMNVVFQGNWAADTDTAYQVHFFFQNEDGTYPTETPAKVTRGGTTDTQASVTENDKADKRLGGSLLYRFDADHAQNVLTGTIAADGSLVLKLYFERVTANYTVHHYLDGTTVPVAADETLSAQVGARVTGKQATAFLDGFAEAKVVRAEPVNATIPLVEDAAQNVITFYYRMPLTLKALSATKNYDGTALTEGGFTVMNPRNLVNGDKAEDIMLKMTGDSSITNPGTEPNEIDPATIRFAGQAVPAYYDITLQEGLLVVVQRLNVRKTITQPAEALPGEQGDALNIPAFSFTLNRDGQPVANALYTAGSRTAATDERGVFTLNAGETATFTALEAGEYTVVEAYNGDWIPDGDGLLTRRATLGTSGAGDVTVSFNNHRIVNGEIMLTKTWVDGNGTAAQRPDMLVLKLIGTAKGVEVYRAPVTLTAQDGWTRKVSNLPMRLNGEMIEYRLIETDVPDGYTAIMDGLTVTNAVNTRNDLTITGTKTWVDGERAHNNATDLTLTLQRSVNNGPWATFNPGQANFAWTGDAYAFTSLPSHDTNGYAYAYRVVEKVTGQNLPPYTVSYTGADGQENGGVASFDENGSATVNLTNTIVDNNDRYLYGTKTWLDGGQTHDNATELTLTLERRSTKPGSEWEHDFVDEGGFLFGWTADRPEQYGFDDLERYDAEGYAYEYRVTETINDPEKAKLYETTYSPADGVSTTTKRQVNITNTLIDPNNVTVSGTKTWVDGGQTHDNATELTLTLTRTSAKQGAKPETVAVVPAWEGNTYTFTNLEQYDAEGYAYTYDVTEAPVEGYTTTQDGYNFTNTIIDPNNVTVSGTKTWVDGGQTHDNADELTLTLTRTSAKQGAKVETVAVVPTWEGNTYTFTNLERYDAEGYAYTYDVTEAPVQGYTTTQNGYDFTNTIIDPNNVTVSGTKTWVDGGQTHNNATELTLTLTRTSAKQGAKPETVTVVPTWEGNTYTFTNLEQYDAEGYAYTYDVTEVPVEGYTTTKDGYNFTNTIIDPSNVTVSGTKTWVDGGRTHDNAAELSLTLTRTSAKQGAKPETVAVVPTWEGNTYTFTNLEQYDAEGYAYVYSVVESEVQGYTTTKDGYNFTNAIIDPNNVTVSGTKTWVDGGQTHDNADELTLTLTRTSAKQGAKVETVAVVPTWEGNTYTFTNLERYDAEGYAYTYDVTEAPVEGYTTTQNGYDFTNTIIDPNNVTVSGTKTWVDGGQTHNNATELTLTLTRTSAKQGAKPETVTVVPTWEGNTYTFTNLEQYDAEGYAYTYDVTEAPVEGYTTTKDGYNFTNTIIDPMNVTVSGTKTWVDGGQTHNNADELTLTLTRTSAKQGAKPETVEVAPAWADDTYTFTNLERYDAEGYAYTYDVTEAPVEGYTTTKNGYDFTNTIIDLNNVTVSGTKTWVDGGQTHNNADELTLTLTRTSAKPGAKPETVAVVPAWEGNTYTFTNLEQYDAEGYAYTYDVTEAPVEGYTTTQNGYDFTNTITQEKRTITGTKTWTDGAENHTQDQIALTLYRQANGSGWAKVEAEAVWQGWTYTFANLDRYDANGYEYAYKVEESTVLTGYTAAYAPADGVAVFENNAATVNITNTLKLVGGDGRLTVTKTWEDKGGDPKDRPKVSFQLLNGDGTPAKKDGQDWIVPLDTATDTAVFENVPLRMDGYIVKELIDSTTNTYGYVADAQQKAVPADGTTAAFTNTRTIASVTVTKHVVDETTDSAAGLAQKFTFELNGERSQPVGNGERASFMVEIGKTYSLTELDANGNPLPSGVWSTTGLGTYTVETANLAIDVINTRTLYGRDGDVTVTKTWLDGDGKPLADALIPEQIDVRLYEGANATGATATLNRENGWKATWSHLPAYALDGTALVYSVKETVDGADYGDGAMVMIGERKFAVSMNGFAITNALENSEPTRPEKSADEVSMEGVQPGDPVTYTIRRTSHLGTTSTATVTDRLPVALDFVSTDSVKVNGEKRNLKATVQGKTATWTIQNVPPMGTIEVVFTARVTEDAMDVDVIANKATVDLGDKNDSQFESNVVPIPVARLILSKSAKLPAGKDKAALGDPIDYTITLRNAGEVVLSDVTIRDAMLERADGDVLVNGSAVKFEGQTIRLDELWQKKTATVTYRVIVTEEDILNGTVDNTATANAKFGRDKALPEQEAKTSTPTEPKNGHLKVEKRTVSQPKDEKGYVLGETIRYEIVVTNDGNLTIADIKVTDSLSSAKDKVIGTIKSLAPGASETFAFEHKVTEADILAGKVVNEATATGKSPDPEKPEVPVDPGETEDKTEPKKGHLKVEKRTVSQPKDKNGYRPGETIRYEIKVTNDGNLTITDIKVTDSLSSAKDKVIGTIKSLAPGASETFAFEHKVTDADVQRGKVVNEATATGESPDPEKPEVPVDPGKEEDKTQPNPPDSDDDAQDVVKEEETFGFGAGYASVSVYDCCE